MTLPPDFWQDERRRLLAILLPKIERAALTGIIQAQRKNGIGLNLEMANQRAADWARSYTDDLLSLLGTTSEKLVGDTLSAWIETPGATMGDLVRELTPRLAGNRYRADLIAVTETTRAYSEGEEVAYQVAGVEYSRWRTNNDELVCKWCGPLNGKIARLGEPFGYFRGQPVYRPPFHPGCRCWRTAVVK